MSTTPPTLLEQLAARAGRRPDDVALRHVDGRSLTVSDLLSQGRARAAALRALGVRPGDRVIVYVDDYLENFLCWVGVALAHAVEVPVNPALRSSPLVHPINDSGARLVLTTAALQATVGAIADRLPDLDAVVVVDADRSAVEHAWETVSGAPRLLDRDEFAALCTDDGGAAAPRLWDTASIIYTSGTTGPPKGVIIPWGLVAHNTVTSGMKDPAIVGPRYCYSAPFHMSGKYNFSCAMATDQLMVVRDGFSLSRYWSDIRAHDCVYSQLFPQLGALLLRQPETPDDRDNPLRFVICYPAFADVDRFKERFGVERVSTGFGMTEIGGPIVNRDATGENWSSSGTVVDNPSGVEVKLVDEHDIEVPVGEPGELCVRTREPWALMAGYHNRPEATAEAWRNGWFHTGDALVVDERGAYRYVDRKKDCIRHKGENVSSFEVEDIVRRIHGVDEVAAVGVPSPLGEEDIKICVVRIADAAVTEEELVRQLREVMPKYMVPRYVEFLAELPKTAATGRVRKVELKQRLLTESTWDAQSVGVR